MNLKKKKIRCYSWTYKGATLETKPNSILSKDEDLNGLRKINKVLLGEVTRFEEIYQDLMILNCFKNAPITWVDVERSFSI